MYENLAVETMIEKSIRNELLNSETSGIKLLEEHYAERLENIINNIFKNNKRSNNIADMHIQNIYKKAVQSIVNGKNNCILSVCLDVIARNEIVKVLQSKRYYEVDFESDIAYQYNYKNFYDSGNLSSNANINLNTKLQSYNKIKQEFFIRSFFYLQAKEKICYDMNINRRKFEKLEKQIKKDFSSDIVSIINLASEIDYNLLQKYYREIDINSLKSYKNPNVGKEIFEQKQKIRLIIAIVSISVGLIGILIIKIVRGMIY